MALIISGGHLARCLELSKISSLVFPATSLGTPFRPGSGTCRGTFPPIVVGLLRDRSKLGLIDPLLMKSIDLLHSFPLRRSPPRHHLRSVFWRSRLLHDEGCGNFKTFSSTHCLEKVEISQNWTALRCPTRRPPMHATVLAYLLQGTSRCLRTERVLQGGPPIQAFTQPSSAALSSNG